MTVEIFANNPVTTVLTGGTDAPAAGSAENWTVSDSSTFPAASSSATPPTQFHVADPAQPSEIIVVTNVDSTTWTVVRGAENSSVVSHESNFEVEQVISAGALTGMVQTVQLAPQITATGTVELDDGAATVDLESLDDSAMIMLTIQVPGSDVTTVGSVYVATVTPGTGFTIGSTSATDTSTVGYVVVS